MHLLLLRVSRINVNGFIFLCHHAIGTLKGSLHGGANERVFDMLLAIRESGDTERYLQKKLDSKEKLWDLAIESIKRLILAKSI